VTVGPARTVVELETVKFSTTVITKRNVYIRTPTDNVALPAFTGRCCSNRSISPARRAHSSKPAAAGFLLWPRLGQREGRTDRRMDIVPYHRPCSAQETMRALPIRTRRRKMRRVISIQDLFRCATRLNTQQSAYYKLIYFDV